MPVTRSRTARTPGEGEEEDCRLNSGRTNQTKQYLFQNVRSLLHFASFYHSPIRAIRSFVPCVFLRSGNLGELWIPGVIGVVTAVVIVGSSKRDDI